MNPYRAPVNDVGGARYARRNMPNVRAHNRGGCMTRRILSTFYSADNDELRDGLAWYETAHRVVVDIAERHGCRVTQAAGIMAAVSPRLTWDLNVRACEHICATGDAAIMFGNKRKARAILEGAAPLEVLGGNKVRSFYDNIANPLSSATVTVDRHAVDLALGVVGDDASRKFLEYRKGYELVADAYRAAGKMIGVRPSQVQAVAWLTWRNDKRIGLAA